MKTYTCEACGGTFTSERDEDDARAEAAALWGARVGEPFTAMAEICDECFGQLLAYLETEES